MDTPGCTPGQTQWTPNHQLHFSSLSCLTEDEAEGRRNETGLVGLGRPGRAKTDCGCQIHKTCMFLLRPSSSWPARRDRDLVIYLGVNPGEGTGLGCDQGWADLGQSFSH